MRLRMRFDESIHARLAATFSLLLTGMFVLISGTLVIWFHFFERAELIATVRTGMAMTATQSKAAMMFGDATAVRENLSVLRYERGVRWAWIGDGGRIAETYGNLPADIDAIRAGLKADDDRLDTLEHLVLRTWIVQDGQPVGELIVGVDLDDSQMQLVGAFLAILASMMLVLGIGLFILRWATGTITRPLGALAALAHRVELLGDSGERATVAGRDEVGRLAESFNTMLDTLRRRDLDLQQSHCRLRELNQRLQSVREEERTRIAREVHDDIGQRLTALRLDLSRLLRDHALEDAEWQPISAQFDQAIRAVRQISWELRPSVLDTLGLGPAIEWLGQDFQRRMATRCRVSVSETMPALDQEVATELFRICQELLTNIMRHARASRVDIRLEANGGIELEVADNGKGMQAAKNQGPSLGLLGIAERSARIGGKVTITTRPEFEGTRVCVTAPLSARGGAEQESRT